MEAPLQAPAQEDQARLLTCLHQEAGIGWWSKTCRELNGGEVRWVVVTARAGHQMGWEGVESKCVGVWMRGSVWLGEGACLSRFRA